MKQVIFAIALLAMASLTGCLNTDDTSIDENTDTTEDNSDTTDDTKDDELIEPVGENNLTSLEGPFFYNYFDNLECLSFSYQEYFSLFQG